MNDVFIEQLIKKEKGSKEWAASAGIGAAAILAAAAAFIFLGGLAPVVILLVGFAAFHFLAALNVEYEYCFTNGELDVDCIYNKSRRKRKFSCNIKNAEIFCRADNKTALANFPRAKNLKDFSSGSRSKTSAAYAFVIGDSVIIIEPDERLFNAIKKYLTVRVLAL